MTEMVRSEQQFLGNRVRKWVPYVAGAAAMLVADAALAASGGPFGDISNFIQQNFMPFIGTVGIAGGVGGLVGLFIISEMVGRKWFAAIMLSLMVGVLDGLLIGVAVALFPSMF